MKSEDFSSSSEQLDTNEVAELGVEESDTEEKEFDFSSVYTDNVPTILKGLGISLVVTSYQSAKLFFIRSDGETLNTNFKTFYRPMGLAVDQDQITLGTFKEVLKFSRNDSIISELDQGDKVDACFVPRASHTTGMINIHDIAYGDQGLWVVNSEFSCLATLEPDYSFVPQWKPPFITDLKAGDRCHLNGMAMRDGKPGYVTTFSKLNEKGAWREEKYKENIHQGTLIDVERNTILIDGLCMPHSPRYYNGLVYFCESGNGLVQSYDPKTGKITIVLKLQGFTRGMDFYGPLMFIGLSKPRKSDVAVPAPIFEKCDKAYSGIWIVNLTDNQVVGYVNFEGDVDQIYDVAVLSSITYPELLEPDHEKVPHIFNFPNSSQ